MKYLDNLREVLDVTRSYAVEGFKVGPKSASQ
jgi:hypothetical protein